MAGEDEKKREEEPARLEWRDFIAVVIASMQTTLLPFLIVIVVLLFLWFVLGR